MSRLRNAPLRTAAITTLVVGVLYVLIAAGVLTLYVASSYSKVDQSLQSQVREVRLQAQLGTPSINLHPTTPLVGWYALPNGSVASFGFGFMNAPAQPPAMATDQATTVTIDGEPVRFLKSNVDAGPISWIMVGEPVGAIDQGATLLGVMEALIAPFLLALIFFAAWWIGRSASAPVERARRRELAFTADASHELRTPLQVIEAESSLALMRERPAGAYRETIERIAAESGRLRSIVDDLLWLARVEDEGLHNPETSTLDVRQVAQTALERFRAVAARRAITLDVVPAVPAQPVLIEAPNAWIDRLAGVLVDNAIRYTPDGGQIELAATVRDGRAVFAVADSGPGIPQGQSEQIFERFHRASQKPGGAGLGLAIADTVVRSTGGRWLVDRSARLGGAQFEVSWNLQRASRIGDGPLPAVGEAVGEPNGRPTA